MSTGHTPGPWQVVGPDDEPHGDITVKAGARSVCRLWQDDAPVADYNAAQWANASLIAAAPRMLAALKDIHNWLVCACIASPEDMAQSFPEMSTIVDAAIAEATGTTP